MRTNVFFCFLFFALLQPITGYSQNCYTIERDSVIWFSIYSYDGASKVYASEFSYVYHKGNIYNAKPYLDSENDGCVALELRGIDDYDLKFVHKFFKMKPVFLFSKEGLTSGDFFAYKAIKLDAMFFTTPCNVHTDLNPSGSVLTRGNESIIIHFLNILSKKVQICPLPESVISFIQDQNYKK